MDLDKLQKILKELGGPSYRLKQIKLAIYRDLKEGFDFIDNIPQGLRESLAKLMTFDELALKTEQISVDGTIKRLFLTVDNLAIESVLIKHEDGRRTICVSTEAGCQINCSFCATGHLGFKRVLTSYEIFEQVLSFARSLKFQKEKVTNVVFMGMGEPFLNYDNVKKAILLLNDKEGFNLGQRHISVSTSGIVPGIEAFTKEDWQINLAISLHAATDQLRSQLMPINKTYPLSILMPALDSYVLKTNRKLMIEYLLLGGINDSTRDAEILADLIRKYKNISRLSVVNLIIYNATKDNYGHWDTFRTPEAVTLKIFEEILSKNNIAWTRRVSFGGDISGACGQLAGEDKN
ncbi:MAG TPA: 23S rRNA (adenine(2503)-C(2))-methyltransferase RlmN [Candidatus Paceibacterota bacterium]|nr:23S rRNA (adenine(2503)-C(2))-methyltransferase RlmN [Candidatus Paceibacterota bacterium]